MQMTRLPRPKAARPSSVKPLLLTNNPRVHAAFCSILPWKVCSSATPIGWPCHLASRRLNLASELEAAVDLLPAQTKGLLRGEAEGVEQAFEKSFEGIAARMGHERGDLKQVRLDLRDRLSINGGRLRARRRALGRDAAREAVDESLISRLGIGDRVGAAGPVTS